MSKQQWGLALAAVLGLLGAVEACSDSDTSPSPGTAGSAGSSGTGGHAGSAGHAGSTPVAGATSDAGQAGDNDNYAGASGDAGAAGATDGGSAGTSDGGSAGNTTGGTAGSGGTGGTAGVGGTGGVGGVGTAFSLQTTTLGQVIGTADGLTLYVVNTDTPGAGATPPMTLCTGACLVVWPIYYGTPVTVPPGLLASDFGSYDRGGSVMQSTYKGWPLYTYYLDTVVGDVKGEGIGNKWYSVKLPFTSPGATTFTKRTTTVGDVIGTASGLSLYVFKADTPANGATPPASACTGGCLAAWPIYYGSPVSVPLGLLASDFGSFDRGGSVMQSTYKGWPVYTYAADVAPGDVAGEGSGGQWYTAKTPFVLPP